MTAPSVAQAPKVYGYFEQQPTEQPSALVEQRHMLEAIRLTTQNNGGLWSVVAAQPCGLITTVAKILIAVAALGNYLTSAGSSRFEKDAGSFLNKAVNVIVPSIEPLREVVADIEGLHTSVQSIVEKTTRLFNFARRFSPMFDAARRMIDLPEMAPQAQVAQAAPIAEDATARARREAAARAEMQRIEAENAAIAQQQHRAQSPVVTLT